MDSAGKGISTWTAQLSLNWYQEGCDTDVTPCPLPIPPTWREARNLEKCARDEIATATDPLYPGRRVYRRTISFEYDCAAGQLEIRTPHRSRRRAAARVDVWLCSKDLEGLQGLDKSIITDPSNFERPTTGVIAVGFSWINKPPLGKHYNTTVCGLFDFIWLGQWAPDFSSWLLNWHNIRPRPSPIPGDHTAVFLDMDNHSLQRRAINELRIHLGYDPKKHSNSIYRQWPLSTQLPVIERGPFIQISGTEHGYYAITSQAGTAPIVPRWERITKEEHEALVNAMEHPRRNRDEVVEDFCSWPSVAAWHGLGRKWY